MYPKAKVDVLVIIVIFFRIFAIPAWIVLGLWFAIQIFGGLNTPGDLGALPTGRMRAASSRGWC